MLNNPTTMNQRPSLDFGLQTPTANQGFNVGNQQNLMNWGSQNISRPQNSAGGGFGMSPVNTQFQPLALGAGGASAAGSQQPGMFSQERMFGGADQTGWLTGGMQVGQGMMNSFLGLQGYRQGRRQMADARETQATNLSNQARTTNMAIHDRFQSRYGGGAGDEALLKWGVSGERGQTGHSGAQTAGGSPTATSGTQTTASRAVDTNKPSGSPQDENEATRKQKIK